MSEERKEHEWEEGVSRQLRHILDLLENPPAPVPVPLPGRVIGLLYSAPKRIKDGQPMPVTIGDDQKVTLTLNDKDDAGNAVPFVGTAVVASSDATLLTVTAIDAANFDLEAVGPLGTPGITVTGTNADGSPIQNTDGTPLTDVVTIVATAAVGGPVLAFGTPVHK